MAYQKQVWENLPSQNTPLSADRLNHMEDGIADAWEHGGGGGGDTLPIGIILPLSSSTIPEGYLLCDGSAISRTEYSTLFSVIGTTYGAGDGETTFNLPDLQGKVPVGQDSNDTDFDTLGETGGEKAHTLLEAEIPSHTHKLPIAGTAGSTPYLISAYTTANKAELGATGATGGDQPHNNLQPYTVIQYIIKALNAQTGEIRSESLPVGTELDYDGETVPTGWEQINDPRVYSETEQVIGTWVNGEPLYRICYKKTGNVTNIQTGITNVDDVISLTVMVRGTGTNGLWRTIPWCFNNNTYEASYTGGAFFRTDSGIIGFQAGSGLTTTDKYIVIMEYTKTTSSS